MRVPLAPFQEAFHRLEKAGEISAHSLAIRLGWTRRYEGGALRGDSTRVLRYLGLMAQTNGRTGRKTTRTSVNYSTGVKLCRAMGVDPVDVGV